MEGIDLLDKAMNVGYNMLMGKNEPFTPTDSDELEDMIIIPDPEITEEEIATKHTCLLYTSPSPRDRTRSRMPSSA